MNHSEIVSFLWGVADLIRDTFKRDALLLCSRPLQKQSKPCARTGNSRNVDTVVE
jgi:hypothetical protein